MLDKFFLSVSDVWKNNIWVHLRNMGFNDILDIFLLSVILYYVYKFIRDKRASKLLIGLGVVVAILVFSYVFKLNSIKYIFQTFFQVGLIALIILFQPELRDALEKVGNTPLSGIKRLGGESGEQANILEAIDAICDSVFDMSRSKTGALIVFERSTKLGEYTKTGVVLNAHVSRRLLGNIFFNKAPLHDGAVIIRDYRIYAASCMLPLTKSEEPIASFNIGTRHRAAIGISEISDAIVVVVSEETGVVSVAMNGTLKRNYKRLTLKQTLLNNLVGPNYKNLNKNSGSQNENK